MEGICGREGEIGKRREREREPEGGREGYPLHCCVTRNLIERERGGRGRRSRMLKLDEREREPTGVQFQG